MREARSLISHRRYALLICYHAHRRLSFAIFSIVYGGEGAFCKPLWIVLSLLHALVYFERALCVSRAVVASREKAALVQGAAVWVGVATEATVSHSAAGRGSSVPGGRRFGSLSCRGAFNIAIFVKCMVASIYTYPGGRELGMWLDHH